MNQIAAYLALFLTLELIYYIKGNYEAMAITVVVFGIFAIIFFLYSGIKGDSSFISIISDVFKPPHQRVKKIIVGNSKASNNTIIRIEKETQKIHHNEDNRNSGRNDNSVKDSTSCIIKIPNSTN